MSGNLTGLINCLDEGLIFVNGQGVVQLANRAANDLIALVQGKPLRGEELQNRLNSVLEGYAKLPLAFEMQQSAKTGRALAVRILASPIGDGYLLVLRDLGDAKRQSAIVGNFANLLGMELTGRLQRLADALEQQLTELIPDGVRRAETASALKTLARQGEAIQSRMIQLATFAQVFSRTPLVAVDRIPVGDLINALNQRLKPLLDEKRVKLKLATGWQELPVVYGSQAWLVEAVYGYIEHVLHHCQRKTDLELVLNAYGNFVRLQLNNRGLGVPRLDLDDASPFDALADGQGDGLGLGLPLCRQIVALHKGHLRLNESDGEVVAMVIELPAGAPADEAEAHELEASQARRYAEDLAKLMQRQRKKAGVGERT